MVTRANRKRLTTVAAEGDRLATLEKLRGIVSKYIEDESIADRDRMSFVLQLRQILKEIDEIKADRGINDNNETVKKVSVVDEISARRKARVS